MKSELTNAWAIVIAFWAILAYLVSGAPWLQLPFVFLYQIGLALGGFVLGWLWMFMFRTGGATISRETLAEGDDLHGCKVNMGKMPRHEPPQRQPVLTRVFAVKWWSFARYAKTYPKHAKLMLAIAEVMATRPDLPASPVPGGHGGATLFVHSMRVVRAILQIAPGWKFLGIKRKDGSIDPRYPVQDERGFYEFSVTDPLLPLVALAHDIGKIQCYEVKKEGAIASFGTWLNDQKYIRLISKGIRNIRAKKKSGLAEFPETTELPVVEKTRLTITFANSRKRTIKEKVDHDTEGARMLRLMPELWELPRDDVDALLLAVAYYHKPGKCPVGEKVADRSRALLELLIEADQFAGKIESGKAKWAATAPAKTEEKPTERVKPNSPKAVVAETSTKSEPNKSVVLNEAPKQSVDSLLDNESRSAGSNAKVNIAQDIAQDSIPELSEEEREEEERVLQEFTNFIIEPDRINGGKLAKRVGFKYREWVYVSDPRMRLQLDKIKGDGSFSSGRIRGGKHPWTATLLRALDRYGVLKKQFGDLHFTCRTALFVQAGKEGRQDERYVFIFKSSFIRQLNDLKDAPIEPVIRGPIWPALHLKSKPEQGQDLVESAPDSAQEPEETESLAATEEMKSIELQLEHDIQELQEKQRLTDEENSKKKKSDKRGRVLLDDSTGVDALLAFANKGKVDQDQTIDSFGSVMDQLHNPLACNDIAPSNESRGIIQSVLQSIPPILMYLIGVIKKENDGPGFNLVRDKYVFKVDDVCLMTDRSRTEMEQEIAGVEGVDIATAPTTNVAFLRIDKAFVDMK